MSRDTLCFSMYSLMSMRIINFSSSKRNSASARANSVLPTPVGPRKINEPMGRFILAQHALPQTFFHVDKFLRFAFQQTSGGNSRPLTHKFSDVFFVYFFLQHWRFFLHRRESFLRFVQLRFS